MPFIVGYYAFTLFGLGALESVLVATALTATSIAISVQVLSELGKMQTKEARLILGAAIVDDILAIAALSVVTTMVQRGNTTPDIIEITFLILKILGLFVILLVGAIIIVPRILHVERLWRSEGSVEGITTASFFGAAGIAAFVGLSPIVGAFSVGMAVASTRVIKRIGQYVSELEIIFAPLFFAIIGAQVDLRGININVLFLAGLIVAIAIITKLIGCGIPSMIFLRDKTKAMKVGVGMISRGEVGLIIAGVGVSAGALATDTYTSIIIMIAATTIIAPIWLKIMYKKEEDQATTSAG